MKPVNTDATIAISNLDAKSGIPLIYVNRQPVNLDDLPEGQAFVASDRLQQACGGAPFHNMYADCNVKARPRIDYVAHAAAMGAHAVKAAGIGALEAEIAAARGRSILIDTTAKDGPGLGDAGHGRDVAVPAVDGSGRLRRAYATYLENAARARRVN